MVCIICALSDGRRLRPCQCGPVAIVAPAAGILDGKTTMLYFAKYIEKSIAMRAKYPQIHTMAHVTSSAADPWSNTHLCCSWWLCPTIHHRYFLNWCYFLNCCSLPGAVDGCYMNGCQTIDFSDENLVKMANYAIAQFFRKLTVARTDAAARSQIEYFGKDDSFHDYVDTIPGKEITEQRFDANPGNLLFWCHIGASMMLGGKLQSQDWHTQSRGALLLHCFPSMMLGVKPQSQDWHTQNRGALHLHCIPWSHKPQGTE